MPAYLPFILALSLLENAVQAADTPPNNEAMGLTPLPAYR